MLNRVVLIGRLTHDPELRYTGNGIPVANFSLAVDRPFTNQQGEREADFIRIVVWRKIAEVCANNLGKGRLVAVEGRIQVRSYENKEGQKRQAFEVVGENVKFLDWPKDRGGKSSEAGNGDSDFPLDDDLDIGDDDLPF